MARSSTPTRHRPFLLTAPALIVIALLFLFPAVYNIVLAFQKLSPYDSPGDAVWVGLANFKALFTSAKTASSAWNTAFWLTAVTVVIRLALGMALALLLQSQVLARWKLRGLCRTAVLVPWMVPPVVAVACWKWLLDANNGILNQVLVALHIIPRGVPFLADTSTVWWAVIAIIVWRELPFVVIVLMAGLQSVPDEQYEAAALDGAGRRQAFLYVTVPNLRPVITVVVIMTVIQTFNNFVYVWLSTGGGPGSYTQVLATQLYSAAFIENKLGQGAAIGIVMSVVMALFAIVYFRVANRGSEATV
jgi:multiple sugar transport system permease protein